MWRRAGGFSSSWISIAQATPAPEPRQPVGSVAGRARQKLNEKEPQRAALLGCGSDGRDLAPTLPLMCSSLAGLDSS